jgi:hypothetical protein
MRIEQPLGRKAIGLAFGLEVELRPDGHSWLGRRRRDDGDLIWKDTVPLQSSEDLRMMDAQVSPHVGRIVGG